MIRSLAFTTQGRLHSRDIDVFLMPTLLADTNLFLWIDLEAPTKEEVKTILENVFHFHPLSIEDCVTVSQSPKVEEYNPKEEDRFAPYLFIVIHAVDYSRQDGLFATSELDFFLGKNFLVTYHEKPLRSVTTVEDRAIKGLMQIARAPDRVAHSLLDALVDNYKPALDELSVEIGELEQMALQHPNQHTLNKILQVKKEVLHLRQIIGPQREVLSRFADGEFKLIRPHMVPYYRDVYDALFHIGELAQGYTDSLTGILQVYLNMSSNQTGEVVKLLTLITVVTTPLMMIGTWYGMNFDDMPELHHSHAYPIAFVFQEEAMVLISVCGDKKFLIPNHQIEKKGFRFNTLLSKTSGCFSRSLSAHQIRTTAARSRPPPRCSHTAEATAATARRLPGRCNCPRRWRLRGCRRARSSPRPRP
jgi:magnesium transporter